MKMKHEEIQLKLQKEISTIYKELYYLMSHKTNNMKQQEIILDHKYSRGLIVLKEENRLTGCKMENHEEAQIIYQQACKKKSAKKYRKPQSLADEKLAQQTKFHMLHMQGEIILIQICLNVEKNVMRKSQQTSRR